MSHGKLIEGQAHVFIDICFNMISKSSDHHRHNIFTCLYEQWIDMGRYAFTLDILHLYI